MTDLKVPSGLLFVSDICLAASVGVPWMTLSGGLLNSNESVSPASIVWKSMGGEPSNVGGLPFVVGSFIYIGATLMVIFTSVIALRRAIRDHPAVSYLPGTLQAAGAVVCGLIGLFAWQMVPIIFGLSTQGPDITISAGIPLMLAGALLAIVSLPYIAFYRLGR